MLSIRRILLPSALADTSRYVVHQAAWLARRFHSEVILLHVVTPLSYPAGILESGHEITARDLHAHIVQQAQKDLDQALRPELDGIVVTRLLLRGDPADEIVKTARDQNVDLIVMPTRGEGGLYRFLLGSVTAKVLHESHCSVWTGAHLEETPVREFSIRRVLCSVDLNPHSRHTASLAAEMAAAVDATLTLVHITSSVEIYGPGGSHVDPVWKEKIVSFATEEIAKLQQDVGTKAEVIIDSGNVPELLNRAAERTKADVLVIGHIPGRSHLGDNGNGYGIIRESHIPVLSV
ncbi:MAG: universal stress protein [Bryobacteraceae bacterium]|jgi:nucleotide-binding universal stress UspA family protein